MTTKKRVCLLTGASGQLGTAFCRAYAEQYDIAAVYRRSLPELPSQCREFVDPLEPECLLRENEHPIFAIQADLIQDQELARIVELVLARFDRIDVLVNAAGHYSVAPLLDAPWLVESADRQFHLNTVVPLKLASLIARRYWRDKAQENCENNRNVINVSSTAGLYIYANAGQSVYSATKAALNYLTCHMASEFQEISIRVNAVAPDTFPQLVPTERVADALYQLDQGAMTGKILVLKRDGEYLT